MTKERKIDMVILGLLSHEKLSGYDIKKRIDDGIRFFWKGSFGSIYPALSHLEKEGFIRKSKEDSNESGRERIAYEITEAGRSNLQAWLSDSKTVNDLKYEVLLKIFFGGAVENHVSLATIEAFEKEIEQELKMLQFFKQNLSKVLHERDHVFFYLTVSFGVETYEGYLRWCQEAKTMLSEQNCE
ncbi:MAG: PadR family transcriptional regulator [Firmicutes bacterium]|nr:PadR family transcriptional regulator [Bacillota bacterium]